MDLGLSTEIERTCDELAVIDELLQLDGKDILELGCGRADKTRALARTGHDRRILALEVDETQHRKNASVRDLPNVRFALGGAEAIPAEDGSFDVVFLFKSLHHVDVDSMDRALLEIARVLRPGGYAYVSEPIFRGDYNEVLRIFHDESEVRRKAFEAVERAVRRQVLDLESQTFFCTPVHFASFEEFEALVIGATHSDHELSEAQYERVRSTFASYADRDGARFEPPVRVDLLSKRRAEDGA